MTDKYDIILSAEEQFAREVTLGVIVQRPLTVWHYLIPGMFIIDFLRRNSEIRRYAYHFMFPRKQALEAANLIAAGEERPEVLARLEISTGNWLASVDLNSPKILEQQIMVIDCLIDHYIKLMAADGHTYSFLIKNAYQSKSRYADFLAQLGNFERKLDIAILDKKGADEAVRQRLIAEQNQLEKHRKKSIDKYFLA